MTAYYNEIDPRKAAWLRELITRNLIAPGDVDERSISDVFPGDIAGYTQCHWFAGIGVWSYALRLAGWPDDRPVWTGSCPCQPFSAAGKGRGTADERHLWPDFHHLIRCGRPPVILGEQVSSPAGLGWWDVVSADLEAENYTPWAVDFSSAGVGAPIIRQRLYWMACAAVERCQWRRATQARPRFGEVEPERRCNAGGLDGSAEARCSRLRLSGEAVSARDDARVPEFAGRSASERLGPAGGEGLPLRERKAVFGERRREEGGAVEQPGGPPATWSNATAGFWRDPDWLYCRDDKWRPVEPGTFPLSHGAPARVGRLRGYGDAINAEAAKAFIEVVMEVL